MNMGNDWKNRRPPRLAGETLGMEQGIPAAISRETRVSEIQHFTWVSVKQLRSCTKLSPPSSLRCAPAAGMSTWTLSNGPDAPLPRRIQGRTEESCSTRALNPARRCHSPGARVAVGAVRKLPFGSHCPGELCHYFAEILRFLHLPPCPPSPS